MLIFLSTQFFSRTQFHHFGSRKITSIIISLFKTLIKSNQGPNPLQINSLSPHKNKLFNDLTFALRNQCNWTPIIVLIQCNIIMKL